MDYVIVIAVAAIAFGLMFLIDKGFTRLFRNQAQHKSGLSVRLSKRYGSIGIILVTLGLASIFAGLPQGWLLIAGGVLILLVGIGLIVYYMTFGVFYDKESFLVMTFGKKEKTYRYADILTQQLFVSYGNTIIELHLSDGRSIQLNSNMEGAFAFMDGAFDAWLQQTGRKKEECSFYDPDNCCWFPTAEE